jgi:hypothetical protein
MFPLQRIAGLLFRNLDGMAGEPEVPINPDK